MSKTEVLSFCIKTADVMQVVGTKNSTCKGNFYFLTATGYLTAVRKCQIKASAHFKNLASGASFIHATYREEEASF